MPWTSGTTDLHSTTSNGPVTRRARTSTDPRSPSILKVTSVRVSQPSAWSRRTIASTTAAWLASSSRSSPSHAIAGADRAWPRAPRRSPRPPRRAAPGGRHAPHGGSGARRRRPLPPGRPGATAAVGAARESRARPESRSCRQGWRRPLIAGASADLGPVRRRPIGLRTRGRSAFLEAEAKMKEAERVAERDHASTVAAARPPETAKRGVAGIRTGSRASSDAPERQPRGRPATSSGARRSRHGSWKNGPARRRAAPPATAEGGVPRSKAGARDPAPDTATPAWHRKTARSRAIPDTTRRGPGVRFPPMSEPTSPPLIHARALTKRVRRLRGRRRASTSTSHPARRSASSAPTAPARPARCG